MIGEARTMGAKVHFASLMDICHVKNAELEAKHQKYKGRVLLRVDVVKDDSGSHAVFAEQRIISIANDSSKIHGFKSRLSGCAGRAADAVSACTQVKNARCTQRHLDSSTTTQMAKIMVQHGRSSQSFPLSEICTVILWQH